MLEKLISFSINNKSIILLSTLGLVGFGLFSLTHISIGAVPDVTNNQVQVITTSRNLSTQDVERYITYPVELEMANLPGVKEIRSTSKFGLSVVTIVFEDDMGTYLPRQLIEEKIKAAEEAIPKGFGKPFLGPVSTGLGEIYQYVLDVKPRYEDQYDAMELRTIQDWIVKRQLSGINGIVEINSWGGYLKQYEVAINPEHLSSFNLGVDQVFAAIEKNNDVAGGGYIEKLNQSYFIRGEGKIASIEQIGDIVVENRNGLPIYVKDIAEVGYGSATRFGAITGNGEGEKVLGQIMMLKDGNSKAIIERVKKRVQAIAPSLPEGVYINPFLERSELIGRTTNTIVENLLLGCLIVIFVVVLLLGNMRSGLVVASVIPLSLLFALSMMYLFGVDANLMSLGAIDFGIIIDGAVIIVEFIAFQIVSRQDLRQLDRASLQQSIDDITVKSTNKMLRSAVFGQLIILIVFIPILSLVSVEGKMFRPMALTFCFALIGAMILCFTYVPVISALVIRPSRKGEKNIAQHLIHILDQIYHPLLRWSLHFRFVVVGMAIALLFFTGYLFSRIGGEFIPTLDEGDFVIQPVLKTGTSLSKTIELTTRMEQELLKFPEVEQVVSRIGAAEVPTDPMSMEESDVIITLKPRSEWVSASTKDELANRFEEALSIIPGVEYEFTQPIEMRFNELITGVRADLAIKIFGEDLDLLYDKALEIKKLINGVEGAADITVEKIVGLPQMSVRYKRDQIAKYGLNVNDLNKVISMGFAGIPAGRIFEGEKQFDIVVRYRNDFRKDIDNLENAYVPIPGGRQVPLSELAEIRFSKGPAKISREDTKRRVVVGVNVRNRDLESVVEDVQNLISENIKLPAGYQVTYGGQFENLRTARQRLLIAVPIALALIFIMLYFAFHSIKEALLIFSAIPLAAVGAVLLLWIRGLPFSISAGVGFIALFGIAVLNGIVLIEHFKSLRKESKADLKALIVKGARQRLRPVLLTAAAAALGFLPMAVSTSAGAEVQRPLATVVVGGLITATLLTLIVLPVLYYIFSARSGRPGSQAMFMLLVSSGVAGHLNGQNKLEIRSLNEAIAIARDNNMELQAMALHQEKQSALLPAAWDIPHSNIYYSVDQNNIAPNGQPLRVWGITQTISWPGVYQTQKNILQTEIALSETAYEKSVYAMEKDIALLFHHILFLERLDQELLFLDSIYSDFSSASARRLELGESNYLEQLTAKTKQQELLLRVRQNQKDIELAYLELKKLLQIDTAIVLRSADFRKLNISSVVPPEQLPEVKYFDQLLIASQYQIQRSQRNLLPDFELEYFTGSNPGGVTLGGFSVGVSLPLWWKADRSKIKSRQIEAKALQKQKEAYVFNLKQENVILFEALKKHEAALQFYEESNKELSKELIRTASRAFQEGEIDFFQYILSLESATRIEINHLRNLAEYNDTVLKIKYLQL